jgi:hypothetical protein
MSETSVPVNLLARIKKRDFLSHAPGHCSVCSRATHEDGFADPDIFIEWHGRIVFCYDCTAEMARLFGMITVDEYAEYKRVNQAQADALAELRSSVDDLEKQVDNLSYERLVSRGLLNLPGSADPSATDSEEVDAGVSDESGDTDELANETERLLADIANAEGYESSDDGDVDSDSTEPVVSEGPDDVNQPASVNAAGPEEFGL